jgi:hypothetical protein
MAPSSDSNAAALSFSASGFDTSFSKLPIADVIFAFCSSILKHGSKHGPCIMFMHTIIRRRDRTNKMLLRSYTTTRTTSHCAMGTRSLEVRLTWPVPSPAFSASSRHTSWRSRLPAHPPQHTPVRKYPLRFCEGTPQPSRKLPIRTSSSAAPGGSSCPSGTRTAPGDRHKSMPTKDVRPHTHGSSACQ